MPLSRSSSPSLSRRPHHGRHRRHRRFQKGEEAGRVICHSQSAVVTEVVTRGRGTRQGERIYRSRGPLVAVQAAALATIVDPCEAVTIATSTVVVVARSGAPVPPDLASRHCGMGRDDGGGAARGSDTSRRGRGCHELVVVGYGGP
ncbi:hypothetical protein E2562_018481 [Oryza meyeriana var. granulata]|uniref:Uncharacterized protein n=1 Tax=Oryza meyeriana var. granulata TaxID=110450 RepID=A0A6G1EMI9_9ORYZ|nr:hypothetical protein E2562_018481 [Oryza meyeriana var. granulata]